VNTATQTSASTVLGRSIPRSALDLLALLWRRRWVFVAIFIATVSTVVVRALIATPMYRAVATAMPRQGEDFGSGAQALLSQLGGVAALAGLNVGASLDEQEAIAWLRSRALTERLITDRSLLRVIFDDMWDASRDKWIDGLEREPSMDDAWQVFDRRIRRVSQDARTRLVSVEVTWKDRHQAAEWANDLLSRANEELRMRAIAEADASLQALEEQLAETDVIGLRQSIYRLTEAQLNRKVLANARRDYAFAIIDSAVVPDEDRIVSPRRRLMVLISIPLALFAASCAIVVVNMVAELMTYQRRRTQVAQ
jgi:uncharacterized protein involved in exopolysaccharide biosynthesis